MSTATQYVTRDRVSNTCRNYHHGVYVHFKLGFTHQSCSNLSHMIYKLLRGLVTSQFTTVYINEISVQSHDYFLNHLL